MDFVQARARGIIVQRTGKIPVPRQIVKNAILKHVVHQILLQVTGRVKATQHANANPLTKSTGLQTTLESAV